MFLCRIRTHNTQRGSNRDGIAESAKPNYIYERFVSTTENVRRIISRRHTVLITSFQFSPFILKTKKVLLNFPIAKHNCLYPNCITKPCRLNNWSSFH